MASQPVTSVVSSSKTSTTTTTSSHSALTSPSPSVPKETWKLTWKIHEMKHLVGIAKERESKQNVIAKLPFEMGTTFGQEVSLEWVLKIFDKVDPEDNGVVDADNNSEEEPSKTIGLELIPIGPLRDDLWLNLFFLPSMKIILDDKVLFEEKEESTEILSDHGWEWTQMVACSKLDDYLDSEGSMTLVISLDAFYDPDGDSTTIVNKEDFKLSLEKSFVEKGEPLPKKIACLLGDKETSDMSISVVNEKDEEIASFPCHSAILSAQSRVFRAMFVSEGMAERKSGVVTMNDVSPEVVQQFLSFVYSGRFKKKDDKANENGFVQVWAEIVPQLVYMADKYSVKDLLEFCDLHFHVAVNEGNALEMYKLAKRHGLTRAQARLRDHFAKNVDLLLQSISTH